jgi:RHS repeat-associated protein
LANTYNEAITYDKNGNIQTLKRNGLNSSGFVLIDDLTYSYVNTNSFNQLTKVVDNAAAAYKAGGFTDSAANTADDYSYDANGNMTTDNNKNITAITYNHLNLPTKITFGTTGNIVYFYNATGQKVQKIVNETGKTQIITDYLGGYQYESNALKFFPTAEGYVEVSGSSFNYIYQYKDHLGNIRLSYQDKDNNGSVNTSEIIQENNYYAFGLTQKGYNGIVIGIDNKLKYNGKEFQDENIGGSQLNLYDYGARNYDPALGRWMNIDPLSETSRRFSPYTYALNNPVFFIDPDGMEAQQTYTHNSQTINGRHQMWSDRHPGSFPNESNNSVFANPELPMDVLQTTSEKSTATADNLEEVSMEDDEPPVSFFGKRDPSFWHNVFNKEFKRYAWTEGDGVFRVYGHGWLSLLWDDTGAKDEKVYSPKIFNDKMSKKSASWAKAMKEHKEITLVLYVCSSGSPNGKSIAQKISKTYDNITVIAFDGYVMYSPTGVITGISKEWPVDGRGDNQGEQVSYKSGNEVPGSRTKKFKKI